MSDTIIAALIGVVGIVVGALITLCGLGLQSVLQSRRERKLHIMRKREELYINACQVLMEHDKYRRNHQWPQKCKDMFNALQGQMIIYASKKIYDEYYELDSEIWRCYDKMRDSRTIEVKAEKMADKIVKFGTKMRKELGIKGVLSD
ncbi:hypothetical protein IJ556_04520 [bacterium]|nr:hypothetical protein [bacterium]